MRIHIGTDHAGFELKNEIVRHLNEKGYTVRDHGALTYDPDDDYPPFCFDAATAVAGEEGSFGIVIGGSGNGEQIAANKIVGIRAALAWNTEVATLARAHNDANVLAMGAREVTPEVALAVVDVFLTEPFSGEPRHARRIRQLTRFEEERRGTVGFHGQRGKSTWVD